VKDARHDQTRLFIPKNYFKPKNNNRKDVCSGPSFVRRGLCRQEAECVLRAAQTVLGDVATADLWGVEGLHIPRGFDERILRAMLTRLLSSLVSLSN
jgi:hypothetical protein